MVEQGAVFNFSLLEAEILESIDHVGWYAYLWFPIVYRDVLNFGSNSKDEDVHAAFASLIRKGALFVTQETLGEFPDWRLASDALESAMRTLAESRGRNLGI